MPRTCSGGALGWWHTRTHTHNTKAEGGIHLAPCEGGAGRRWSRRNRANTFVKSHDRVQAGMHEAAGPEARGGSRKRERTRALCLHAPAPSPRHPHGGTKERRGSHTTSPAEHDKRRTRHAARKRREGRGGGAVSTCLQRVLSHRKRQLQHQLQGNRREWTEEIR